MSPYVPPPPFPPSLTDRHPPAQPVVRRLLTRCLGLIPSVAVAASLGRAGVSTLLVVSQVVLSIVLPFMVFPLVHLTSSARFMSVRKPAHSVADGAQEVEGAGGVDAEREEMVDFSNGRFMTYLGWFIWLVIVLANGYAIVTLAMGED